MTADDLAYHATWRAASGHPGGWRVVRTFFHPLPNPRMDTYTNKRGRPVLYRTQAAAQRRADKLHKAGGFLAVAFARDFMARRVSP